MPGKELAERVAAGDHYFWLSPEFWTFLSIVLLGFLGRTLIGKEPLDKRQLAGEAILTAVGAVGMYAAGLLQGLSVLQMIVLGSLAALGGIRAFSWLLKAAIAIKKVVP